MYCILLSSSLSVQRSKFCKLTTDKDVESEREKRAFFNRSRELNTITFLSILF